MFENFHKHVETKIETAVGGSSRQVSGVLVTTSSYADVAGSRVGGRKRSKSRSSQVDRTMRLTAEQKCEIAQRELEEYTDEVRRTNEVTEKQVDYLKVSDKALISLLLTSALYVIVI